MADRFSRRWIIGIGVFVWSIMATACGLARSATQLFWARVGVGVGEAALSPAAYSMLTDLFPREKQGGAFSIYNMGITIGSGLALLIGGLVVAAVSGEGKTFVLPLLGEVRAWQMAFIITGLPGVLLPLLLLSVREPVRRGLLKKTDARGIESTHRPSFFELLKFVGKNVDFYSLHFVAMALLSLVGYGVGAWLPSTLVRTYGITAGHAGIMIGTFTLVINTAGLFFAGKLSDHLTKKGRTDAAVIVCFLSACGIATLTAIPALMPNITMMWVALAVSCFTFHGYVAMGPMIVNQVTPNQMRALVSALYLFVVNMIGMMGGPVIVPLITRLLFNDESQIRYGLSITIAVGGTLAAVLLWIERSKYKKKMLAAAAWQ
ncbi:MAG: MFS transporter, partial [Candidatus Obscuribacterales bacterium]|nr:MFS transporter [Steroidobacteraceae bacterium]